MKKILLILVLPFLICGFTNQEEAISNLKQCGQAFTENNFSLAKQYCDKVLEIQKKGAIADIAYTILTITQFSDEKDLLNNLDKFERFPISYFAIAEYYSTQKDYEKAIPFYRKALKHKYDWSKFKELPLEKEYLQEIDQLRSQFYTTVQSKLGILLIDSEDEKEVQEGLAYLKKAYKKGDNTLLDLCEYSYYNKLYENIDKFCTPLAKDGNEKATLILAYVEYLRIDNEKVNKLLKPLIKKENKDAKCLLGVALTGEDDENARQKGIKLLQESIEQKSDKYYPWVIEGKYYLASSYYNGKDVDKDYKKAFDLFNELEQIDGLSESLRSDIQVIIGFMHFIGHGTPINDQLAYEYWQKAYKAENLGAIPLIEYDEFKPYLALMFGFKALTKESNDSISEYAKWMHSGKGKKYLVEKEAEEIKENIVPSLKWFNAIADDGYDFANWYVGINLLLYGGYDKAFEYLDRAGAMKKPSNEEQKI